MRFIMIIGDGMADRPLPKLNYKTPLEAAEILNMDRLASGGVSGLLDPIAPGIAPGSDAATLSILGYDPLIASGGRGPFEATGAGLKLQGGDVAFRCNFATVDSDFSLVDERAGRIGDEAKVLSKIVEQIRLKVNSDISVFFKQSLGFKGAMILRGDKLSGKVTSFLPKPSEHVWVKPLDSSIEAKRTADALNEFIKLTYEALSAHPINAARKAQREKPANIVIPWSGSKTPVMQPFKNKYKLKASCVAAASLIKGIANFSGMENVEVAGATGDLNTDTIAKADAALSRLDSDDFILVHVEGADEASHDGNVEGKIAIIKKIDALVGRILDSVDLSDVAVALMPDHATSCLSREHTGDPVPICFGSDELVKDGVKGYNERAAYKGGLNRICGRDVMPLVLNLIGNS